jgi:hypothetical protein
MANEAVRTRQYREYLDADKTISRQIYNLYQRQEAAYKEGPPSIRNQNQLAPISGVIEAVNALQSELQNLTSGSQIIFSMNNFVPVIKAYNSLVFALRSIQNIYKRNVQIKYEVDKLLKPVIEMIQSVASQLAYDPAVSNRLFQMRTNLVSKVFERIDYNVGKRTLSFDLKSGQRGIETLQPGSDETLDTFQQPVMEYKPENNDPFLGQTPIKSEAPATFEGLDVAGFDLNDDDRTFLKNYMEAVREVGNPINWPEATGKTQEQLKKLSTARKAQGIINRYFDDNIQPLYDQLTETARTIIDRSSATKNNIKATLTDNFLRFRGDMIQTQRAAAYIPDEAAAPVAASRRARRALANVADAVMPPDFFDIAAPTSLQNVANYVQGLFPVRRQQQQQQQQQQRQQRPKPSFSQELQSPPGVAASPASPQYSVQQRAAVASPAPFSPSIDMMNTEQLKKMLVDKNGPGVYNAVKKQFGGNGWDKIVENIKEQYVLNQDATVNLLNTEFKLNLPPAKGQSQSKRKQPGLWSSLFNFAGQDADDD